MRTLVGRSSALRRVVAQAELYARKAMAVANPEPVLLLGPTGVGKELVARHMHEASGRPGAFVPVSGGELVEGVFSTQLFGHVDGAYTGAGRGAPGAFEHADRGTLLLDELQLWPPAPQAALLRAVGERDVQRLRGRGRLEATCALLVASSVPLDQLVAEGRLLLDLRERIGFFVVEIPPLIERKIDILVLANHFLEQRLAARPDQGALHFDPEASERLLTYRWPGNVREVERVVAYAEVHADGADRVGVAHLPPPIRQAPVESVDAATRAEVAQWMLEWQGTRRKAAALLGIHPHTLDYRVRKGGDRHAVTKSPHEKSTT